MFVLSLTDRPIYQSLFDLRASLNDQYSFPDLIMHFGKVPKDERSATEVEAEYVTEQKSVRCTPLIRAIQMQDFNMAERLLTDGADPNARDSLQRVPLVHAIRRVRNTSIRVLFWSPTLFFRHRLIPKILAYDCIICQYVRE